MAQDVENQGIGSSTPSTSVVQKRVGNIDVDDRKFIIKLLGMFCYKCCECNYPSGQDAIQHKGKF